MEEIEISKEEKIKNRKSLIDFAFNNGLSIRFFHSKQWDELACTLTLFDKEPLAKHGSKLYGIGETYQEAFDDMYYEFVGETLCYRTGVEEVYEIPFVKY